MDGRARGRLLGEVRGEKEHTTSLPRASAGEQGHSGGGRQGSGKSAGGAKQTVLTRWLAVRDETTRAGQRSAGQEVECERVSKGPDGAPVRGCRGAASPAYRTVPEQGGVLADGTAALAMSSAVWQQDAAMKIGKLVLEAGELEAERATFRNEHRGGGFSAGGAERAPTGRVHKWGLQQQHPLARAGPL